MAGNNLEIDPSQLRPGTTELRRAASADRRVAALIRRVESYFLHRHDLESAHEVLVQLADQGWPSSGEPTRGRLRTAAMHGAVAAYFRCFDSDRRRCLEDDQVFRGEPDGLRLHRHWRAMRHGHVAHDSNPWSEAQVLVEVGADGRALGTYLLSSVGVIHDPANITALAQVVEHTLGWVLAETEDAQTELHGIVTTLDVAQVASLPAPRWTAPTAEMADTRR